MTVGWINYYGKFYRSALHSVFYRLDQYLVRWAMRKYKRLKNRKSKAWAWPTSLKEMVHYGHATEVINARRLALDKACDDHPERFVRGAPGPQELPGAVWINKPVREDESEVVLH